MHAELELGYNHQSTHHSKPCLSSAVFIRRFTYFLAMSRADKWPWQLTCKSNRISLQMEEEILFSRRLWSRSQPNIGSKRLRSFAKTVGAPKSHWTIRRSLLPFIISGAKINLGNSFSFFPKRWKIKHQMNLIPSLLKHIAQMGSFCSPH